jgi:hypothetical protein
MVHQVFGIRPTGCGRAAVNRDAAGSSPAMPATSPLSSTGQDLRFSTGENGIETRKRLHARITDAGYEPVNRNWS